MEYLPNILVAFAAYAVGTASPGPATLAIIQISASLGRSVGLRFAYGVIVGSLMWGVVAALGLSALMISFAWLFVALKIVGGTYLLWLAFKSCKSALSDDNKIALKVSEGRFFTQGLALHLTNPKAIFVWSAIIALGLPEGAPSWVGAVILFGCGLIGVLVFSGFALLFSTKRASQTYRKARRKIDGFAAALFAAAGFKLLFSRS